MNIKDILREQECCLKDLEKETAKIAGKLNKHIQGNGNSKELKRKSALYNKKIKK